MLHKADPSELLDQGVEKALRWLEETQTPKGFWAGFLKTNSAIEAEWILAMHFLGISDDPKSPEVVRSILSEQRPDGSWEVFHDAPAGDVSATVECYAALAGSRPGQGRRTSGQGPKVDPGPRRTGQNACLHQDVAGPSR